jgi:hypothetical protein
VPAWPDGGDASEDQLPQHSASQSRMHNSGGGAPAAPTPPALLWRRRSARDPSLARGAPGAVRKHGRSRPRPSYLPRAKSTSCAPRWTAAVPLFLLYPLLSLPCSGGGAGPPQGEVGLIGPVVGGGPPRGEAMLQRLER